MRILDGTGECPRREPKCDGNYQRDENRLEPGELLGKLWRLDLRA